MTVREICRPQALLLAAMVAIVLLLSATVALAGLPQIMIEAEDYSEVTGGEVRVLDRAEASGGRCVSYWEEPGVAVTCEFEVTEAGEYCLTLGYALNWPDTRREIRVDGEIVPGLEDVLLPTTGSWGDFSAMTLAGPDGDRARIHLEPGMHTLTLTNVDSRGLAWDFALLHGPEDLPADAPLTDKWLLAMAGHDVRMERLLLEGTVDPRHGINNGDVSVLFHDHNAPVDAVRVGNLLFDWQIDFWVGEATRTTSGLGALTVSALKMDDDPGLCVSITDGRAFYRIEASVASETAQESRVEGPAVIWRDGEPWALAPRRYLGREPSRRLEIDGMQVSAPTPLSGVEDEWGHALLAWPRLIAGQLSVGALKVGPQLPPADPAIGGSVEGDEIVIRSSAEIPSALAEFYGITQFEVRVHSDATMTITTDAGETLELPAR